MKAVILAAGSGKRLAPLTRDMPKCLLRIGGKPILEHLLTALGKVGIQDIVVVAGYRADDVKAYCRTRCRVIVNDRYAKTNSIYSLWLSRAHVVGNDFVFLNADTVYDEELLADFLNYHRRTACLIDNTKGYRAAEYQLAIKDGRVIKFSKGIPPEESAGESAQVDKISAEDSRLFFDRIDQLVQSGEVNDFPLRAYDVLLQKSEMWPVFTLGRKWFEIDTLEDYIECLHAPEWKDGGSESRTDAVNATSWMRFMQRKQLSQTIRWLITKTVYYVRARQWPWRLLWIRHFVPALFARPITASQLLKPLITHELSHLAYDLQIYGEHMLRLLLLEAQQVGIRPFLVWGTLLGCVREGAFIKNDADIDLALLEEDFAKIHVLKEALLAKGFQVRIEDDYKLSCFCPKGQRLIVDFDLVYPKNGHMVISNADTDNRLLYSYYFSMDTFSAFRTAKFQRGIEVRIPAAPEKFLEAVYGDWTTPRPKTNYLYTPRNLVIEPHGAHRTTPELR